MSTQLPPGDSDLLAELASLLLGIDPVPEHVYADAEAAFDLTVIPAGLERLELLAEPALVRSGSRSFRFAANEIAIDVRLSRLPWGARLEGLIAPATDIEVHWPTGLRPGRPDSAGYFRLDELPNQPLRIVVESCVTPWFWP